MWTCPRFYFSWVMPKAVGVRQCRGLQMLPSLLSPSTQCSAQSSRRSLERSWFLGLVPAEINLRKAASEQGKSCRFWLSGKTLFGGGVNSLLTLVSNTNINNIFAFIFLISLPFLSGDTIRAADINWSSATCQQSLKVLLQAAAGSNLTGCL